MVRPQTSPGVRAYAATPPPSPDRRQSRHLILPEIQILACKRFHVVTIGHKGTITPGDVCHQSNPARQSEQSASALCDCCFALQTIAGRPLGTGRGANAFCARKLRQARTFQG